MPTHITQTPLGDRPYAYCPDCGWAAIYETQAMADAAGSDHECPGVDERYDEDGVAIIRTYGGSE